MFAVFDGGFDVGSKTTLGGVVDVSEVILESPWESVMPMWQRLEMLKCN